MSVARNTLVLLAFVALATAGCKKDPPAEAAAPAAENPPPVETPAPAEAPPAKPEAPAAAPAAAASGSGSGDESNTVETEEPEAASPQEDAPPPPVEAGPQAASDEAVPAPPPVRTRSQVPTSGMAASPLPDLRLLLTTTDIDTIAGGKTPLRRTVLAGVPPSAQSDAMMYEPTKGTAYGVGIQLFREGNAGLARDRFNAMLASYSAAQEIAPVSGRTLFAYWGDVQYVGFIEPTKNLVIVLSCGRTYCKESDDLYDLARKVSARASK